MRNKLCFKTLEGYLFIRPSDINFVKSEDVYAYIFNDKSKYFINCSLKDLEKKLTTENFMRCHRSYLVNLDKVVKFIRSSNYKLLLENGLEIPISRGKKEEVARKLGIDKSNKT